MLLCIQLGPLTDLDSEDADVALKCRASKSALVVILRTWVGLVYVASDSLGLCTVVAMLRDSKVDLNNDCCSDRTLRCYVRGRCQPMCNV
jgi:hypothetical protein